MMVTPIKTELVTPGSTTLLDLIDASVTELKERSIVVITSKIVSLCENRVVRLDAATKEQLMQQESDYYTSAEGPYGFHFTITQHTLIPSAGIDESNSGEYYVLWPQDAQQTANEVREHLIVRHGIQNVGVVITDSTSGPLRRGTMGIALAHSGFKALHNYIGQPDLFDRPFKASQSNVAGGLAASAVVTMGEGSEQTPLCVIQDATFVEFQDHNPTSDELAELRITKENDIFAPFLSGVVWEKGQSGTSRG